MSVVFIIFFYFITILSCGAQPSSGAACATKSPVVFAQWSTDIWACNWRTWCAAFTVASARLPGFLDLHMALERCHVVSWFGSCIFTWHLLPRRGKMSLTYSISCEAWLLACGCLVSPPMFLAGVASVGFQLRTRMHASSCFKIISSRAKLLQMVPWMRPSTVDCCHCVLLLGQRLHSHLCCPACADFCPQHELANVKAYSVIGAPNNQVWSLTPRGPSLHAIILLRVTLVFLPLAQRRCVQRRLFLLIGTLDKRCAALVLLWARLTVDVLTFGLAHSPGLRSCSPYSIVALLWMLMFNNGRVTHPHCRQYRARLVRIKIFHHHSVRSGIPPAQVQFSATFRRRHVYQWATRHDLRPQFRRMKLPKMTQISIKFGPLSCHFLWNRW